MVLVSEARSACIGVTGSGWSAHKITHAGHNFQSVGPRTDCRKPDQVVQGLATDVRCFKK